MEIRVEETPAFTHITLTGRLDIEGSGQIETRLTAYTSTTDEARIVLDLGGVEYLASIGLGLLVRAAQGVQRRRGKLVLLNPQPLVRKVLSSSSIDTLVPVLDEGTDLAAQFQ
ncbi:MAG: STAS domain-containing protein [Ignavibacteriae bacterium]|nr:STAS domain-containing protein [Ignavibacteriota bacterium]